MFKKILKILFLIFLLLVLAVVVFLIRQQVVLSGRAAVSGVLSLENSYLFASPLVAKAGGGEKITVSAFVLSDQGLGIAGKKVVLYSAPALSAVAVREETDNRGMAVFEVSSQKPGEFRIWAQIPGEGQIKQTVLITFE